MLYEKYVFDWEKAPESYSSDYIRKSSRGTVIASVMFDGVKWAWSFRLRRLTSPVFHSGKASSLQNAKTLCDNALRRHGIKLLDMKLHVLR
jgi:hypothetical protein